MATAIDEPIPTASSTTTSDNNGWQNASVSKSFNDVSFDYQIKFHSQRPGYRIYKIRFPSPVKTALEQNNTVPAEYYLPDGIGPDSIRRPAVICLHILDGNDALTDLVASALALRGVPAIMFRLPYYGERGLADGPMALAKDPKLFAGAIAQAGQDFRRTIDVLASRPEIDPKLIGTTGISLGGIVAATAAGGEPRINRASFILAGGDLVTIIHHARETRPLSDMIVKLPIAERRELESKIAEVDPLRFASTLREKAKQGKVMMLNAGDDEVIPRNCTEKLADAMQMSNRVQWIPGLGHYTSLGELPKILKSNAEFFAQDLPTDATPPVVKKQTTPLHLIADILQQFAVMLDTKPLPGKCHVLDLELTLVPRSPTSAPALNEGRAEATQNGRFRLIRGSENRFALYCKLPAGTEISVGQNDHPWMTVGPKEVYDGTENPGKELKEPLDLLGAKQLPLLKMLTGVINGIALAPDVLERLIVAKDMGVVGDERTIRISPKENYPISGRLLLKSDGNQTTYTPQSLTFDLTGAYGTLKFVNWQLNTPAQDAMFQPPENLTHRKVDQSFLYTLFSTSLKYILPSME